MNVFQSGRRPLECISSAAGGSDGDLLAVKYVRVDRQSPEYVPVYKGIDQNVDITTSTFVFRAAPEPVISLYEFIMTTFVPERSADIAHSPVNSPQSEDGPAGQTETGSTSDKINVSLKLASVQGKLSSQRYHTLHTELPLSLSHQQRRPARDSVAVHGRCFDLATCQYHAHRRQTWQS